MGGVVALLVTGGAGFLGSAIVARLLKSTIDDIVVIDDLSTGSRANLPCSKRLRLIDCDINRMRAEEILAGQRYDLIFHLAATVGVVRTLADPERVLADRRGIEMVAKAARMCAARRLVFASSSEVYGPAAACPMHEIRTPLDPQLPYGQVKVHGETVVRAQTAAGGAPHTILRFFNVFGELQSRDFVLPDMVARAVRGEPLLVCGDGLQTRCFMYIDDAVDAVMALAGDPLFENETVNVGSDEEVSMAELATLVVRCAGSGSRVRHVPARPHGDARRRRPDVGAMRSIVAPPSISLDHRICRMIENYRSRYGQGAHVHAGWKQSAKAFQAPADRLGVPGGEK
jgi:UDP-glucuronate decarboxylase